MPTHRHCQMASPGARSPDAPPFGRVTRAPTAAVGDHQHEVEATVRHFQELSAREDVRATQMPLGPNNQPSNASSNPRH